MFAEFASQKRSFSSETQHKGLFFSHHLRAERIFESKENEKQKQSQGRDHVIIKDLFVGSSLSRVMFLMRLVTLSPYFFPSFLPRLLSSLQGSSVRSFEGEGSNFTLERNGDGVETF